MKEIRKLAKEGDSRKGALTILAKDLVRCVDFIENDQLIPLINQYRPNPSPSRRCGRVRPRRRC